MAGVVAAADGSLSGEILIDFSWALSPLKAGPYVSLDPMDPSLAAAMRALLDTADPVLAVKRGELGYFLSQRLSRRALLEAAEAACRSYGIKLPEHQPGLTEL